MRVLAVLLPLLVLAACAAKQVPQVQGNQLIWPTKSRMSERWQANGQAPSFERFSGEYPELWPAKFQLPAETFITNAGRISIKRVKAIRGAKQLSAEDQVYLDFTDYNLYGVTKGSPAEVLAEFTEKAAQLGIRSRPGTTASSPRCRCSRRFTLLLKGRRLSGSPNFMRWLHSA